MLAVAGLVWARPSPSAGAELVQDPKQLVQKLRAVTDPKLLDSFLVDQQIVDPEGEIPVAKKRVEAYRGGAAYDLFQVNLFGSEAKEAVVQLRFDQRLYLLVFFEHVAGAWRRVPGSVPLDGVSGDSCRPSKCPGFFCMDFVALRTEGESAIVGRTCQTTRGNGGGDVEELWIWQVGAKGPRVLLHRPIRESTMQEGGTRETRLEYRFGDGFPKKLMLREASPGKPPGAWAPFDLPFEG
jgi:hypothetical protein